MHNIKEEYLPVCEDCKTKMNPIYSIEERFLTGERKIIVDYFSCPSCLKTITVDDSFDIALE